MVLPLRLGHRNTNTAQPLNFPLSKLTWYGQTGYSADNKAAQIIPKIDQLSRYIPKSIPFAAFTYQ